MSFEWERTTDIGSQGEIEPFKRGRRDGQDPVLHRVPVAVATSSTPEPVAATLEWVADRAAIYDVLVRYCRGVDRRDEVLIRTAYHNDASDDHGAYRGGVDGLIEYIQKEVHSRFRTTMHKLGQALIEVDGDVAHSETYAICHHIQTEQGADRADVVAGIRFLDRFERRKGIWRIAEREIRYEWVRTDSLAPLDPSWTLGTADAKDPIFTERG
jgi:hypothetical protein